MESADTVKIAEQAFDEIARRFPHLYMVKDEGIPVELSITLPVQPGLRQEVRLYLANNDELNIVVGYFWGGSVSNRRPVGVPYLRGSGSG